MVADERMSSKLAADPDFLLSPGKRGIGRVGTKTKPQFSGNPSYRELKSKCLFHIRQLAGKVRLARGCDRRRRL